MIAALYVETGGVYYGLPDVVHSTPVLGQGNTDTIGVPIPLGRVEDLALHQGRRTCCTRRQRCPLGQQRQNGQHRPRAWSDNTTR